MHLGGGGMIAETHGREETIRSRNQTSCKTIWGMSK
jgi:hypothetical protein